MSSLEKTALRCLGGFINGIVIIDEANEVLVNTAGGSPEELRALKNCFGDREAAVKSGVNLAGSRYEVHKHYPDHNPPMVYGRTMHPKEDPLNSSGENHESLRIIRIIVRPLLQSSFFLL